jgi:hypothetical protein
MRRRQLRISAQWYPCHCHGHEWLTWAVFDGKEFLCYSHSLSGAKAMLEYLKERWT